MSDSFDDLLNSINEEFDSGGSENDEGLSQNDINDILGSIAPDEAPSDDNGGDEVLSQNEISDLLGAIEDGAEAAEEADEDTEPQVMIKIYDFYRPDFLSNSDMRIIDGLCCELMQNTSATLNALTGFALKWNIASIDVLTNDELCRCQPNPSAILPVDFSETIRGCLITSSRTAQVMLNHFLGTVFDPGEIETGAISHPSTAQSIFYLLKKAFEPGLAAWTPPGHLNEILTDPSAEKIGDPLLLFAVATVNLHFPDDMEGMLSIALPRELIENHIRENSPEPAENTASENSSDFLVKKTITYKFFENPDKVVDSFRKKEEIPVSPRILGQMNYEKRGDYR